MTIRLCIAAMVLLSLASCQKGLNYTLDSLTVKPVYQASFKVNGQQKSYSGATNATFTTTDDASLYNCSLLMAVAPSTTADRVVINITDTRPFSTGTKYTGEIIKNNPQATIVYTDGTGKQYSSAATSLANVTIMFTENTADHLSGTFSGTVQNATDIAAGNTANAITITEGVFTLRK